ncbi:hypothetical protein Patl1_29233 [Pistacia atlantica]|uniref:Uncharacterized protein n=1 Tax=Pistacia atlantica TaxID=434234 RepID=A0ACC1BCT2_9ROSI|nr:hypothetical protein Patl1_29233 [Pistacia atlantica]
MLLYQLDFFLPAHMPVHDFTYPGLKALKRNDHMLQGAELLGLGVLRGPEDIVYDSQSNVLCMGCEDGRIKRVTLNNSGLYWIAFALVKGNPLQEISCYLHHLQHLHQSFEFATNTWDCQENAGVMAVDLEGKPIAHYHDPGIPMISSRIKIGDHLYCGSICNPYILRLDLNQHPAHETT